jgi:hypothetical protein
MQFQLTMSFRLVSVHDNLERLGGQQATVFGMEKRSRDFMLDVITDG